MTPEEKALLQRTAAMAEENNQILRSLRRSNRVSSVMRVLYWVVIIGLSYGAIYFIQPYLSFLTGLTGSGSSSGGQTSETQSLLDTLKQAQSAGSSLQGLLK